MTGEASAALEALGSAGLAGWTGLPPGQAPDGFAPALRLETEVLGMSNLGMRKALFRGGMLQASGIPVRVWVTPDESEVLALDVESPAFAPAAAAWLEALGEPDRRLDTYRRTVIQPQAEWVWPRRGAAAFVDLETGSVWRALLFPAGSDESYDEGFRMDLRASRRPARRF